MENSSPTQLTVKLVREVDESYPVVIGGQIPTHLAAFVRERSLASRRIALITDSNLGPGLASQFVAELEAEGVHAELFTFPAGEANKTRATKAALEDALIDAGFGRDSLFIAFGGGVATDLVGFVAATFTRGVPYVSVPTTLLACADAALGGKTAVDTPVATNLIGAFHQPSAVFIDVSYWRSLPRELILDGMGESVKHACLADAQYFGKLEEAFLTRAYSTQDFQADLALLEYMARRNAEIKADFVTSDVHEGNRRMGLNLGHTIGRALEAALGYTWSHGACVAVGLHLQALWGSKLGYCSSQDVSRVRMLLEAIGLPVWLPENVSLDEVMAAMFHDKKAAGGRIRFVFQEGIGALKVFEGGAYARFVEEDEIRAFLTSTPRA